MNTDTVAQWLDAIGVPPEVVSIGAEADDAWCVLRCEPADPADGADTGSEWEVFWREQGNRYDWARFTNEQVACYYLFGRLAWTQVASGALRLAPPPQGVPGPGQDPDPGPVAASDIETNAVTSALGGGEPTGRHGTA